MMKMIRVSVLMAVAMTAMLWAQSFNPPAGSAAARHGGLRVQDNRIVDKHGQPVALRGMSFFWNTQSWGQAGYYTKEVVDWLVDDWKVTVVRVAIDPNETSNGNWRTVANAAIAKGIYVIIDYHAHSYQLSDDAKTFFEGLSSTYGNHPQVIYEIFNEPCATQSTGGGGCQGDDWATHIKPYADKVVGAIRGSNGTRDTNVIIIGTPNFSKRTDLASQNKVTAGGGKNLAYAVHFYSGQRDPDTDSEHKKRLRDWTTAAMRNGVAVFASEFGISEPGGGLGNGEINIISTKAADEWLDYMADNHIGWAMWSVSNKSEAAAGLMPGASTSGNWSTGSGQACAFPNGTTSEHNVNNCKRHGDLSCGGFYIRTKLRYYHTPVTVSVTPQGPGTVSVSPNTNQYPTYLPTQVLSLTPNPSQGARFEGWVGVSGNLTANPATVTLSGNFSASAVFAPVNQITNSTFTAGINGWLTNGTGVSIDDNVAEVLKVVVSASAAADASVRHASTQLQGGKKYKLTFSARASGSRTINPRVRPGGISAAWVDMPDVSLSSAFQDFEWEFSAPGTAAITNAIVEFRVGSGGAGDVFLDNVILLEDGVSSVIPKAVSTVKPFSASFNGRALVLSGGGRVADVTVYDLTGRVRMSKKVSLSTAGTQVSLNSLPAGVYTVRYKVDGKAFGANERVMLSR